MSLMLLRAKSRLLSGLVLLAVHQAGCLSELDSVEVVGECGPRDLTPECCLKKNPGQWEQCTGSSEMAHVAETAQRSVSTATKLTAGATVAVMVGAMMPQINSAERRGVALASDLLAKVERAIEQCVRRADQKVNDYHFNGRSPSWELCQQVKVGEKTTWAACLGLFKHEESWPCLREALDKLLPDRYLLHPRFQLEERTGTWKFLNEEKVKQIVSEHGWKGLWGTIEPDIVLMDEKGFIVHVYDLKFPCPEFNNARWERYRGGRWHDEMQGRVYERATGVKPRLVSPRQGIIREG
ncbi:hypothetical protein ATI61_103475 [Archangium gephyra]|uniref:Lipoprotein n=2 Tax=Archangium gephyra TaxID=48 RepID=A0ABX9K6Q3_9BACT|nr:hypothetical protein [Archangium gephyra]REG34569.1 hypothetical protein ATI61_103475 [Archangium gephyra]